MRIVRVSVTHAPDVESLTIVFSVDGHQVSYGLPLPLGWDGMTRSEKIAYCKSAVNDHLLNHTYQGADVVEYPDESIPDQSKDDFDGMPGWADWSAAQAAEWIDANVTDLASAKQVLTNMAKAVIYLRNIVIER